MNMFGGGFPGSFSCPQSMMCPYDVPVPQPYPCPVPVAQPYFQNIVQPVDMPIQNTIQPVLVPSPCPFPVPQPVPVPVECPCPIPVPQPIPVPFDRPCPVPVHIDRPCPVPFPVERRCPVPVPVCVPVPQPCPVPQPILVREPVCVPVAVPVPMPMQAPPQCYVQECYYPVEEECVCEEPICIKVQRRRRHRRRSCRQPPLPPIIIPIPMQGHTAVQEQVPFQVTEYVQDIYPPAQVYTDQVPVGYVASNSIVQQPCQMQNQQTLNCQPGMILPPAPYVQPQQQQQQQQQLIQQLPSGQYIQRPLSVMGGGGVQGLVSSGQSFISPSNSASLVNPYPSNTQFFC